MISLTLAVQASTPAVGWPAAGVEKKSSFLSAIGHDKRHDGDGARAFNGDGQFSLMFGAVARDAAGHDLAALSDKVVENHRILIINFNIGVRAEPAEFFSVKKSFLGRT